MESSRGSITLGELQGKLDLLDIACHRCERRGRVSLSRLIEEHGADAGLPDPRGHLPQALLGKVVALLTSRELRRWRDGLTNSLAPAS